MTVRMETMAWEPTRGPRLSFDMGFDEAVNGGNYLFGDSVYSMFSLPSSGLQLGTVHRLVLVPFSLK